MARYRANPECVGIQMADGTEYGASRDGWIDVANVNHQRELSTSDQVRLGFIHKQKVTYTGCPGKRCANCGFHAHGFSAKCPRCKCAVFVEE